jgi:hypothetical protein
MKRLTIILLSVFLLNPQFLVAQNTQTNGLEDNSVVHPQTEEECTSAGRQWDPEVNRCLYTNEVVETRESYQECKNAPDPEKCHADLASEMTGVDKSDGKMKGDGLSTGGASVATLYSVMLGAGMFSARGGGGGGMCISKILFMGTSVVWLGGDLFLKHSAKKNFEKLKERYDDESKNSEKTGSADSSFESQVRAFAYLKEEQMLVKQQAKNRFTLHIAATAGYGISAAMALFDMIRPGGSSCGSSGGGEGAADAGAGGDAAGSGFNMNLSSPPMIMASSVAMAAINGKLAMHMKEAEKLADSRIKIIDGIMDSFVESMAGFCPQGREDLSNPRCYCYTDSGQKNDNRTNSAICQDLWEQDYKNFHIDPNQYDIARGPAQGCITSNGKFDLECKCKSMINTKTGLNACYKTQVPTSAEIGAANQGLGIEALASQFDSISAGASAAIGNLNAGALGKQAARANRAFGELAKKAKAQGISLGPVSPTGDNDKFAMTFARKTSTPSLLAQAKSGLLSSIAAAARPPSGDLLEAIAQAEKVTEQQVPKAQLTGGKGSAVLDKKKKGKGKFRFNWNEDSKSKVESYTQAEKEQLNSMVSDIVTEESVSIWEVISNRYISSGIKRLFDNNQQ